MDSRLIILFVMVLVQVISGQYIGRPVNSVIAAAEDNAIVNNIAYGSIANNYAPIAANGGAMAFSPTAATAAAAANNLAYEAALEANSMSHVAPTGFTSGGGFRVTSSSPIAASGINVHSDNLLIEGALAVSGQMPFLGVVAVDGPLPAIGQGSVAYACGNGNVGVVSEGLEQGYSNAAEAEGSLPKLGYSNSGLPSLY